MSIPMKAIDRLFERLAATYTTQWVRQFEHVPMQDVKTAWAHELSGFGGQLESLAWALENLPPKTPNVIEFKNLCRAAPRKPDAPLIEAKADPARMGAELAKLSELRAKAKPSTYDGKAWAKALIQRHESGEILNMTSLRFAREALKVGTVLEVA